jgi:hypothetical protein
LLSRLLRGQASDGDLTNLLLGELRQGYPVTKIRLLLNADDGATVAAGMWIASELGVNARPLFDDVVRRIDDVSPRVRFFALDCLLSCAGPQDADAVRLGLELVDDDEPSVRWKALVFLTTAAEQVLRAALNSPNSGKRTEVSQRGLRLLLKSQESRDTSELMAILLSNSAPLLGYAAAAAARMAQRDVGPLRRAMTSSDPTIRRFCVDMAARMGIATS